jgi:hypothetical protein
MERRVLHGSGEKEEPEAMQERRSGRDAATSSEQMSERIFCEHHHKVVYDLVFVTSGERTDKNGEA